MPKEEKRPSLKTFFHNFKENMDANVNLKKAKVESEVVPVVKEEPVVQGVPVL